jgi:predicted aminopeptidase
MRRILAVIAICLPLGGCYLMQAAGGQLDVLSNSRAIEAVAADPATPPQTRERLELVTEAREFAVRELGLPDGRSFRRYADLGRQYAIWSVVATPEFSVEPHRWCFPVAGCVSYLGYFRAAAAEARATRLARDGDDVSVGGVATYSTLGHLPDPVFNTMLGWRETRLVGTIFHELAHERLYVQGDSEFNEAFASVVEQEGVRLWLRARGRDGDFEAYRAALVREAEFAALLRATRERLRRLYASGAPEPQLWADKQREFGQLKFEYTLLRARWGGHPGYDAWFARPLNNAHLAAVATYHDCVPGLQRELEAAGSLAAFYARAEELASLPFKERRAAVCESDPATVGGLRRARVSSRFT